MWSDEFFATKRGDKIGLACGVVLLYSAAGFFCAVTVFCIIPSAIWVVVLGVGTPLVLVGATAWPAYKYFLFRQEQDRREEEAAQLYKARVDKGLAMLDEWEASHT